MNYLFDNKQKNLLEDMKLLYQLLAQRSFANIVLLHKCLCEAHLYIFLTLNLLANTLKRYRQKKTLTYFDNLNIQVQ